jgi:OTU domain-containing protein 3
MRENPTDFVPFITVDQGQRRNPKRKNAGAYSSQSTIEIPTEEQINRAWEDHLKRMAQNGTYGDNMEIRAFGQAYNMDVIIFR